MHDNERDDKKVCRSMADPTILMRNFRATFAHLEHNERYPAAEEAVALMHLRKPWH